ncbi:MAG: AAA family ATPase [Bacteroidales bacterium]|nr:AAA family ATPase [Bacteroidales bacterium]
MIQSIIIDNFRGIRHLDVKLGGRMNLFAGENGAGKSTVLQALRYLLSWYVARLLNRDGRGLMLSQNDITKGQPFCRLVITLDDGTSWKLYKKSNKYRGKPTDRTDLSSLTTLTDVMVNDHERFSGYVHFPVVGCYGVDRAVAEVKPRLSKKSNMEPLDAYEARLSNGHNFSKFFNWFREAEDLENEELRDNGTIKTDGQLNAVRVALEQVSPDYSQFRVSRSPRDFLMDKDGQQFSINQLSDGEKCYLTLVGDIARMLAMTNRGAGNPLQGKGCILVDEVDLHLHPVWQSEILGRLTQIFPGCQFVITTHSPFVVSNVKTFADDKFFLMEQCEAREVAGNTYGRRIDQILLEFFHVESLRNAEVEATINKIWSLLSTKDYESEEYKRQKALLRTQIDSSDEAIAKINLEEIKQRKAAK